MVTSMVGSRLVRFALPALALAVIAAPAVFEGHAVAQKKAKGARPKAACELRNFPIYAGASWTYKSGVDEIKISVESVGPGKDDAGNAVTVIEVDETYKNETNKLKWTCTAKTGLRVAPESFFFTGEPGGLWGSTIEVTKHDDVWLHPDAEVIEDSGWQEKFKANVPRTDQGGRSAKHLDARIEVGRFVTVHGLEAVQLAVGQWAAQKVAFELRAAAFIGEEKLDLLIDDKNPGAFWLVKDLGVVRYEDNLKTRRAWELTATTVPLP